MINTFLMPHLNNQREREEAGMEEPSVVEKEREVGTINKNEYLRVSLAQGLLAVDW